MPTLDLAIIAAYFAGTILLGAWFSRRQKDLKYYFVSGRDLPWWVIMASIVSTETSAVTFISVPGYAFGTDYTFLQLPMGYIVGRVVVSLIFVPAYFRGEVLTVYQLLEGRFGGTVKQLASGLFLVTRTLSDGFRLFATALVLAALFVAMPGVRDATQALMPATDPTTALLVAAVAALGVAMIVYTFLGGMTALIWTDVVQLVIYLIGALASAVILWKQIPGGWDEISRLALAGHKTARVRFRARPDARLHLLVRRHRRRLPHHRHAWHRPVHGPALSVQRQRAIGPQGVAGERRVRIRAVRAVSGDRHAALRVLHRPCVERAHVPRRSTVVSPRIASFRSSSSATCQPGSWASSWPRSWQPPCHRLSTRRLRPR